MLKRINETEFNELSNPILFSELDDRANNNYATISQNLYSFRCSWNSDIEPLITKIKSMVYAIGVDQNFVIVDFNKNISLLSVHLFYNFYDTKFFNEWILVITELEVLKVSIITFTIINTFALPSFFSGMNLKEKVIEIMCSDGEIISIPI